MSKLYSFLILFLLTLFLNLANPSFIFADPGDPLNCLPSNSYDKPIPRINPLPIDPNIGLITTSPNEFPPAAPPASIVNFQITSGNKGFNTGKNYTLEAWYCPYGRKTSGEGKITETVRPISNETLIFPLPITISSGELTSHTGLWDYIIYEGSSLGSQPILYSAQFLVDQPGGGYPTIAPADRKTLLPPNVPIVQVIIKDSRDGQKYDLKWDSCSSITIDGKTVKPGDPPHTFSMPDTCGSNYREEKDRILCMDLNNAFKERCRVFIKYTFNKNAVSGIPTGMTVNLNTAVGVKCLYDYNVGIAHITNIPGVGNQPKKEGIATAVGCIPVSPNELIITVLFFGLGVGGGIAFLLMIMGSFEMIMSQGNPETLQQGQERFQSAIIGLLFVIFSMLLMQIIVSDILQIPGLAK